jgi:hypothetical protein
MQKILVMLLMAAMLLSGCVKVDYKLDLKTATPVFESAAPTPSPSPEATPDPTPEPSPTPTPKPKSSRGWFSWLFGWLGSEELLPPLPTSSPTPDADSTKK